MRSTTNSSDGPSIDQVIANYRDDDRLADVSQMGLRPLSVEGPLSKLGRADAYSERLSQQQHPLHAAHIHTMHSIPAVQSGCRRQAWRRWRASSTTTTPETPSNALYPTGTSGRTYHFYDTFSGADARPPAVVRLPDWKVRLGTVVSRPTTPSPQQTFEGAHVHAANTALGGALFLQYYPLQHNKAVTKAGARSATCTFTRSGFAGLQRYAAATWSGRNPTPPRAFTSRRSPPASATRSPGCHGRRILAATSQTPQPGVFTRGFQFGAFCPMFRIHGQAPKELYGSQWTPREGRACCCSTISVIA